MTRDERDKEMYRETQVLLSAFATEEIGYETCIDAIKDMANRYAYAVALSAMPEEVTEERVCGCHSHDCEGFYTRRVNELESVWNECRTTFLANIKAKTNQ